MPKCNKVKNPCKICLNPVSHKNGLQCQGACQNWVHYSCLNYTPGKIKDVKAGVIKITCPCPDCKSILPKEYRTDQPFSCSNNQCPANHAPRCGNTLCPVNEGQQNQKPNATGCALNKCGKDCKTNSHLQLPDCPEPPRQPCAPPNHPLPFSPSPNKYLSHNPCKSGCSSQDVPGDFEGKGKPIVPSLDTLQQMCNTVGQLTNQIHNLMAKMQQVGYNQKSSHQKGPQYLCKNPCHCPGNPDR